MTKSERLALRSGSLRCGAVHG